MKMYVSVKYTDDDGKVMKEVACQPCITPEMSDLEKASLMLKAFSEITWQVIAGMVAEAEEKHEKAIKKLLKPVKGFIKHGKKV